jgi:urea transporter
LDINLRGIGQVMFKNNPLSGSAGVVVIGLLLMVAVLIDSCHTISTLDLYDEPH